MALGFAPPLATEAAAQTIVVDTLADLADPPFDSGKGTVVDLPGADGHISLREAILAANNTPGPQQIRFAPVLKGGTIVVGPIPELPAITGDGITIDGDIDGDGLPDMTLRSGTGCCFGLKVLASDVTITGLKIVDFHNGIRIESALQPSLARIVIRQNMITGSRDGINIGHENTQGHVIRDISIERNVLAKNFFIGISISAGTGPQASGNQISTVTIFDNQITEGSIAIFANGGLISATGNRLSGLTISRNVITNHTNSNVLIGGGGSGPGTQNNRVEDTTIAHNTFKSPGALAIEIPAAATLFPPIQPLPSGRSLEVSGNVVMGTTIRGNTIRNSGAGIQLTAAFGDPTHPEGPVRRNTIADTTIAENVILDFGPTGNGIFLNGGDEAPENFVLNTTVVNNLVARGSGAGIGLIGGGGSLSTGNVIRAVRILNNTITENGRGGILSRPDHQNSTGNSISALTVTNSIVWRNGGTVSGCRDMEGISTSDISFTLGGPSCAWATLTGDPLFVDARNGDFRLQACSPAIDKGTREGAPATDLECRRRVGAPDIGAFEFGSPPVPCPVDLLINKKGFVRGDTLQVDVLIANPGPAQVVDVYFGALLPPQAGPALDCPGGDALVFLVDGFTRSVVRCLADPSQTFAPLFRQVTIPAQLPAIVISDFFQVVWDAAMPAGTYVLFLALTPPGAFVDGRIDPTDLLALAVQPLSFTPP